MKKLSDKAAAQIVKSATVGRIDTLEYQHSDRLDFHEVSVGTIRDIINRAYSLGYEQGKSDLVKLS